MKKLIERFALFLLRKVGKENRELSVRNHVWYMGAWWKVKSWGMKMTDYNQMELQIEAVRYIEEDAR